MFAWLLEVLIDDSIEGEAIFLRGFRVPCYIFMIKVGLLPAVCFRSGW